MLLKNIKELAGIIHGNSEYKKGDSMAELHSIEQAYLLIEDGIISDFGPMEECPSFIGQTMDLQGQSVLPAWCDSHTHIVFAASREEEFVNRIQGKTYEEIAAAGGGILNSARKLELTSEDELYESAKVRLEEVIKFGTGAIEIKSGYGLSYASELKMLRVIRRLKNISPIPIKSTFLGAHAIPAAYKNDRDAYLDLILQKMLPDIAKEKLADYIDVFCDRGFFTPAETERIIEAGAKYGMKAKIHANELGLTGGVQTGVKMNALSVDHLEALSEVEIECLLKGNTIPTLLPSTAFFLNLEYAPARKMIDSGLGVTLATDYNPGSTPSGKMAFVLSLACLKMDMLPKEAINAATINGAFAIEMENSLGSITKGKWANLILTKAIPSLDFIPYAFGSDTVDKVLIKGEEFKGF
jgi:imidazolonepropionase